MQNMKGEDLGSELFDCELMHASAISGFSPRLWMGSKGIDYHLGIMRGLKMEIRRGNATKNELSRFRTPKVRHDFLNVKCWKWR